MNFTNWFILKLKMNLHLNKRKEEYYENSFEIAAYAEFMFYQFNWLFYSQR